MFSGEMVESVIDDDVSVGASLSALAAGRLLLLHSQNNGILRKDEIDRNL